MSTVLRSACDDAATTRCDVLILKYADKHHGVDLAIAKVMGIHLAVERGKHRFFDAGGRLGAKEILVIGVGPLSAFEYREIEQFGAMAMAIIGAERPAARHLAVTVHGAGYGLDELASLDSLVRGLERGAVVFAEHLIDIAIVERSEARSLSIRKFLDGRQSVQAETTSPALVAKTISHEGTYAKRLFAALPFSAKYLDHWDLALVPAAHQSSLLIERLDHEAFTGDIVTEIRNRISKSVAVVALLDEENPNVFLEIGYAWGVGRPTILALDASSNAPFDVRGQKILRYGRIGELKSLVTAELAALAQRGKL